MSNFDDVTLFGNTTLSDIFKQIHKNNKDIDKQIEGLVDAIKPLATSNAGSAVMLMPTVKDLIDVNVKNNDQLIKMAAIAQRASSNAASSAESGFFDMAEVQQLIEEQKAIQEQGNKLLDNASTLNLPEDNGNKK